MKIALFIEPEGYFREQILDWKYQVEAALPGMPYCSHPPHSTLIFTAIREGTQWIHSLEQNLIKYPSLSVQILRPIAFWNDVMAGGGHTLAFEAEASKELLALQSIIAESIQPHIEKPAEPTGFLQNSPFRESWCRYGFPFVGAHWIPHFSIASLQANQDHPLILEFLALKPDVRFRALSIQAYEVRGDHHVPLVSFKLKELDS
jgi:hypothetical protein